MKAYGAAVTSALVAVLIMGALAPAAAANRPIRIDLPPSEGETVACGFPVQVEGLQEKEKVLDFGDHFIITGVLKWRLTNRESSRSIEVNISGPVFGSVTQDGEGFLTRHTGPTLFLIGAGLAAQVGLEAGLYLSTGLVVVEGTFEDGITSITQVAGTWTDLCPDLV
jgi:hypothetical protein